METTYGSLKTEFDIDVLDVGKLISLQNNLKSSPHVLQFSARLIVIFILFVDVEIYSVH